MRTKAGVHGKTEATRVPRSTPVRALQGVADDYSTNGCDQPFIEAAASVGDNGFTVTGAKPLADAALPAVEDEPEQPG